MTSTKTTKPETKATSITLDDARVMAAAQEPGYRECVARVLGEMYALGGHVQIDEREACTWLDCWDAGLLMYVGRDGTRVLRLRADDKRLTELLHIEAVAP